jgi:chemotaxis-related protein WspB
LYLLFQLGTDRFALEANRIVEVLPLVAITPMPQAPPGVAGLFNYRGTPVPIVDLSQVTIGRPAEHRLNTRLVLVQYPDAHGAHRLLGLIAERATEIVRRDPAEFVASGIAGIQARHLGRVATEGRGLIHRIDLDTLLPETVQQALFDRAVA